jgi:hypothetical protein
MKAVQESRPLAEIPTPCVYCARDRSRILQETLHSLGFGHQNHVICSMNGYPELHLLYARKVRGTG